MLEGYEWSMHPRVSHQNKIFDLTLPTWMQRVHVITKIFFKRVHVPFISLQQMSIRILYVHYQKFSHIKLSNSLPNNNNISIISNIEQFINFNPLQVLALNSNSPLGSVKTNIPYSIFYTDLKIRTGSLMFSFLTIKIYDLT